MAAPIREIESILNRHGLVRRHKTDKVELFENTAKSEAIYLNLDSGQRVRGLVIHPKFESKRNTLASITGVLLKGEFYHNSNMRKFPKRRNGGQDEIHYGIPVSFDSSSSIDEFLARLLGGTIKVDALEDIESARANLNTLTETERDAVVKSRIGQGPFRSSLVHYWRRCAVTGCSVIEALRASHIKPWRDADNKERLDLYNGLLLVANLDALFDRGLISFTDDGVIIVSSRLDELGKKLLGVSAALRLAKVEAMHIRYLQFHRASVFVS